MAPCRTISPPDMSEAAVTENSGWLYRVDPDGGVSAWTGRSASPTPSPGAPTTAPCISATRFDCIYAYDFDPESGEIANRRPFAKVEGMGFGDGSTIDAEGFLWNARWDGGCVIRFAPDGALSTASSRCPAGGSRAAPSAATISARFTSPPSAMALARPNSPSSRSPAAFSPSTPASRDCPTGSSPVERAGPARRSRTRPSRWSGSAASPRALERVSAVKPLDLDIDARRFRRHPRPLGLRQDHAACA